MVWMPWTSTVLLMALKRRLIITVVWWWWQRWWWWWLWSNNDNRSSSSNDSVLWILGDVCMRYLCWEILRLPLCLFASDDRSVDWLSHLTDWLSHSCIHLKSHLDCKTDLTVWPTNRVDLFMLWLYPGRQGRNKNLGLLSTQPAVHVSLKNSSRNNDSIVCGKRGRVQLTVLTHTQLMDHFVDRR